MNADIAFKVDQLIWSLVISAQGHSVPQFWFHNWILWQKYASFQYFNDFHSLYQWTSVLHESDFWLESLGFRQESDTNCY